MATFKLGAIVTEIAGSIGGTTFKRNGSSRVMMNKPMGSAYSRLLKNQSLSYLGAIFKAWTFLDADSKSAWEAQADFFTFPDKFGNLRSLTGRQLYIKLNAQNYQFDTNPIDPITIDSSLIPFTITSCNYELSPTKIQLELASKSTTSRKYILMAELSLQPLRSPTYIRRAVVGSFSGKGNVTINIYASLMGMFPYWTPMYQTRFYVQEINTSGFKSVMQAKVLTFE